MCSRFAACVISIFANVTLHLVAKYTYHCRIPPLSRKILTTLVLENGLLEEASRKSFVSQVKFVNRFC
jgi:hypothetical protein